MIANVYKALETALDTVAKAQKWPVAWPNVTVSPPSAGTWLRVTHFPAPVVASSLGLDGYNRHVGIMRVSVFVPVGLGAKAARDAEALLMAAFRRGSALSYSGTSVRIEAFYALAPLAEPEWYHWPIDVRWRAELPN